MSFFQGEEGDRIAATAIASPERFVLKPQREGGGMSWSGFPWVLVWFTLSSVMCPVMASGPHQRGERQGGVALCPQGCITAGRERCSC